MASAADRISTISDRVQLASHARELLNETADRLIAAVQAAGTPPPGKEVAGLGSEVLDAAISLLNNALSYVQRVRADLPDGEESLDDHTKRRVALALRKSAEAIDTVQTYVYDKPLSDYFIDALSGILGGIGEGAGTIVGGVLGAVPPVVGALWPVIAVVAVVFGGYWFLMRRA